MNLLRQNIMLMKKIEKKHNNPQKKLIIVSLILFYSLFIIFNEVKSQNLEYLNPNFQNLNNLFRFEVR